VSEYEYDEEYTPGADTGSLGRDAYGYDPTYVDANTIAQAAAGSAYQGLEQTYAPLISDHDQRIANVEALMAGTLAQRDMEAERQAHEQDEQLAAEAIQIARQRLDAAYRPGWFDQNRENIRAEMEARPGLLPDIALGETPAQLADGIEMAARKLYAEAVADHQYRQDQRNAADIAEMKGALDREHSIRIVKQQLMGGR
jgi:hypothetical protein